MRKPITVTTTNLLEPGHPGEASIGKMSPLARLFVGESPIKGLATNMGAGASLKKVEGLLEDIKQLPVNKVTEEIRELQVRFICLLAVFVMLPVGMFGQLDLHAVYCPLKTQRTLYAHHMVPSVITLILF